MFTGDRSGDFLFRALYETGFASQPQSISRDDGMEIYRGLHHGRRPLRSARITKPALDEFRNCRPYLERELDLPETAKSGGRAGRHHAFNTYLAILRDRGQIRTPVRVQISVTTWSTIREPGCPC